MSDPMFKATLLALDTLFPITPAATPKAPYGNRTVEGSSHTAAAGLQQPSFDIEAMKADAGAMYDVLAMILDFYENGKIQDQVVTHNGQRVWLIDELARELVERHQS